MASRRTEDLFPAQGGVSVQEDFRAHARVELLAFQPAV
jgi:hypothetical protein